jgi:hypothetical protein
VNIGFLTPWSIAMTRKLIPKDPALHGEGHYAAARRHRVAAQALLKVGKVKPSVVVDAPGTSEEPRDLVETQGAGRAPARS